MATYSDLITDALQELGVLAAEHTASAADAEYGRIRLNRLLDQWALERLTIYTVTRTTWTITASDGQYTVGSGGDINIARPPSPTSIDHVNYIDTSQDPDLEIPLVPLTEDAWAAVRLKALTSTYPQYWYYNPTWTTGTLDLWPVPTSSDLSGAIYVPTALSEVSAITSSFSLPPGYRRFLTLALAVEMAPGFNRSVMPELARNAEDAKSAVKRANQRLSDLSLDASLPGLNQRAAYNIYTGS